MTMTQTETWKTMGPLGFSSYEASTAGQIRSVDRVVRGRRLRGTVLTPRPQNRGRLIVNLTHDSGKQMTKQVPILILSAFDGPPPPGQEARHLDDNPLNNRWAPGATEEERILNGGNLMWGTPADNNRDKVRNGNRAPAALKVPKRCVLCGGPFAGNGKRCHECVVAIGVEAALLLSSGVTLAEACERLKYPSPEGLHTLAVKYGGYGQRPRGSWLRCVFVALRDWLELGDSE